MHGIYTRRITVILQIVGASTVAIMAAFIGLMLVRSRASRSVGMNSLFRLPEASTHAVTVDHIFYLLLVLSGATVVLVFGLILLFAVRYRRGSAAKRGPMPEILSREFEIGWTVATLLTFAFLFWWASFGRPQRLAAPTDALEIHVVAKQWMWKTQHANGAREINELHVPLDSRCGS